VDRVHESVNRVHESVDHRGSGPPWTGLCRRPEEFIRARPTGAPVHESSLRLHGKDEELARVRSRASPEVEKRRGGRATAVPNRQRRRSVREMLKHGEKRREAGRGAVKPGVVLAFYRGRGLLRVQLPMSNGRRFTAEAIDGRGGC
jgi:hypothetical protein